MISIYPKTLVCIARNWQVFLASAAGYVVLGLLPGKSWSALFPNIFLTSFLCNALLRHFLTGDPMTDGYSRVAIGRTFGALLLVGALPLAIAALGLGLLGMRGLSPGASLLALVIAGLGVLGWIALTAMALPAAALGRPILAHGFGGAGKTFLPTLGGLLIGPVAMSLVQGGIIGLMAFGMYRSSGFALLPNGSPLLWSLVVSSVLMQLLSMTLAMALFAQVWRQKVEPAAQADIFA